MIPSRLSSSLSEIAALPESSEYSPLACTWSRWDEAAAGLVAQDSPCNVL